MMNSDYQCRECENHVLFKIDHKPGCSFGKINSEYHPVMLLWPDEVDPEKGALN